MDLNGLNRPDNLATAHKRLERMRQQMNEHEDAYGLRMLERLVSVASDQYPTGAALYFERNDDRCDCRFNLGGVLDNQLRRATRAHEVGNVPTLEQTELWPGGPTGWQAIAELPHDGVLDHGLLECLWVDIDGGDFLMETYFARFTTITDAITRSNEQARTHRYTG